MGVGVVNKVSSSRANQKVVLLGVSAAMLLAGLPFLSKAVRRKEQELAEMRDAVYDAKDAARNARLSLKKD
eukprot:jgi/Botrbrau1/17608/Bobra.0166s0045.1